MAKIKINKLPKGFKLVNGKVEKEQIMNHGGYVTGDQRDYGLVTTPQEYYNNTSFNNADDQSVRYSLSSVPRDVANIEAEGGETVLTDLSGDGQFGLYNINGPRHSSGGVPMFLPEQSFIYSDTNKMKFNKDEMAEFGIESRKGKTPATISKKYQLNPYLGAINDQYADDISTISAELMLKKNMNNLSKLAFGQEVKKNFEDGVPLAAHPYLVSIGEDPIEFTAKVEEISKRQAQMNALAALPPEQQQQLMMLQQMMAQVDQQPQGQGQPQGQPEEGVVEDVVEVAKYGTEVNGLRKYQDGTEVVNPLKEDHPKYNEWNEKISTGNYEVKTVTLENGGKRLILTEKRGTQPTTEIGEAGNQRGRGTTPIYNEDIAGQRKAFNEASNDGWQYQSGSLSSGNRPLQQSKIYNNQVVDGVFDPSITADKSSGVHSYGSPEIKSAAAEKDFMNRWGDVVAQIDGYDYSMDANDPKVKQFQRLAEETRKKEHMEHFGNLDNYKAYFTKDGVSGSKFDGAFGLHTYNTPRLKKNELFSEEITLDPEEKKKEEIKKKDPEAYKQPYTPPFIQDEINLNALGMIDDNLYMPWAPTAERQKIDYVLDDYLGQVNANNSSLATASEQVGNTIGGPAAIAAISDLQGRTMKANAAAVGSTNSRNVATMNQIGTLQPQLDMKVNFENDRRNTKVYDDVNKTLQDHDNFLNDKIAKSAELRNALITNRAGAANLNALTKNFDIDTTTGGIIEFTDGDALEKVGLPKDQQKAFLDSYTELQKNLGPDVKVDADLIRAYMTLGQPTTASNQTNAAAEYARLGSPQFYPTGKSKVGKEIKRMVVPFYTGKMGS